MRESGPPGRRSNDRSPGPAGRILPPTRLASDVTGDDRGALEVEDLLKLVLVLVIVYIAVDLLFEIIGFVFGPLSNLVGLVIIVLIVAWFLDYI